VDDPENMRDPFLLGEGVRRRPEDWVLLLDMEDCVVEVRRTNLESLCSRNSTCQIGFGGTVPKTVLGPWAIVVRIGWKSFAAGSSTSMVATPDSAFAETSGEASFMRLLSTTNKEGDTRRAEQPKAVLSSPFPLASLSTHHQIVISSNPLQPACLRLNSSFEANTVDNM
jgi:hypothetical protein